MILCYYVNLLRLFKPNHRYRIIYSLRLENGVTMTPKHRLLTLILACLYSNFIFFHFFKSACVCIHVTNLFSMNYGSTCILWLAVVCKLFQLSFLSDKTESKTKKRKVAETSVTNKASFDVNVTDAGEGKDDDNLSKEDDVDPLAEGWEASSILGATDVEGQVHFLIQW